MVAISYREYIDKKRRRLQSMSFLDDAYMSERLDLSHAAFKTPRLRQCTLNPATISWGKAKRLGGGADGCVFLVYFGDQGPYALKVFYDNGVPELDCYYGAQREAQNAALLQMTAAAVDEANAEGSPVLVHADPKTEGDAVDNVWSFSTEGRQQGTIVNSSQQQPADTPKFNLPPITSIPRMRQCYGWVKIHSDVFRGMPRRHRPDVRYIGKLMRAFYPGETYTALVYEYVEEGKNDHATVDEVFRFFWLAGFCTGSSPHANNWKSGVLIDLADIINPRNYGWAVGWYMPATADMLLKTHEDDC